MQELVWDNNKKISNAFVLTSGAHIPLLKEIGVV
jgi:hypothetical protein